MDKLALAGVIGVVGLSFAACVAYNHSKEVGGQFWRRVDAKLDHIRQSAFISLHRAANWIAGVKMRVGGFVGAAFSRIIPYARSRTNIVQALQFAGIALAAPLSAQDLETWSTRVWLLVSALLFVAGVIYRGPKSGPAGGPGAEYERQQSFAPEVRADAPRVFADPGAAGAAMSPGMPQRSASRVFGE